MRKVPECSSESFEAMYQNNLRQINQDGTRAAREWHGMCGSASMLFPLLIYMST
jgi:hypothetical protein